MLLLMAVPLHAGSTGTSGLFMPQGGGAGTANGDFVAAQNGSGLDTSYHYFIEVPPGLSRLRVQLFDADIGAGGGGEAAAGRDRARGGAFNTTASYQLMDPSGASVATMAGNAAGPAGADNAWLTLYDSNISGVAPTNGHWELIVDQSASNGDDLNALGIRADDGDSTTGGQELNVYYDTHTQIGANPGGGSSGNSRSYSLYPWVVNGCSGSENDFDYDNGHGTGDGTAPAQYGRLQLWTRANNTSTSVATRLQDIQSGSLSGDNGWTRNNLTDWRSSNNNSATGYGIFRADVSISTYQLGVTNGNYANVYFGTASAPANPPTSNPDSDPQFHVFRTYLGTDAANSSTSPAPPQKPYLEQQVTYVSGPNPPTNGQTTRLNVTVRLANPIPASRSITFSGTTTADNVVVAPLPGISQVTYVGSSAQTSCGSVASQPANGATAGNVIWSPGTVAGQATCLFVYQVDVTPTAANQTLDITPAPILNSAFASATGTRARFRDQTANASQARALNVVGPLCNLQVSTQNATRALVARFSTEPSRGGRLVQWTTSTEEGTAGFYLYRTNPRGGAWEPVVSEMIAADPRAIAGASYRVFDPNPRPGARYTLVEVESNGERRVSGPYWAESGSPGFTRGADSHLEPADDGRAWTRLASGAERLRTEPDSRALARLQRARFAIPRVAPFGRPGALGARIHVLEPGLYRVGVSQLASALDSPDTLVRGALRRGGLALSNHGQPVAWFAAPDFSALYFYGEAPHDELEADNVYRVFWRPGTIAPTRSVAPISAVEPGSFQDAVNSEVDSFPVLALPLDPATDLWFWDYLTTSDPNHDSLQLPIDAPDATSDAPGTLEVRLFGASETGTAGEHEVDVLLNGRQLGSSTWTGLGAHTASFPVDGSDLLPSGNQVELQGFAGNGASYSTVFVDGLTLHYQRRHRAAGDRLAFTSDSADVAVTGFAGADLALLDVTDPSTPERLLGAELSLDPDNTHRLSFHDTTSGRRYLALSLSQALTPRSLEADAPRNLLRDSGAEYLVIAPRSLAQGANELAQLRSDQGLSSEVVWVDDIYDAFSDGIADPRAIKSFLAWTQYHWPLKPTMAVLLGGGSFDLRDRQGLGGNLIPPYLVATEAGVVAADARLGDTNGDGMPEVIVGRVPILDETELDAYLAKLQAFEEAGPEPSNRQAMLLTDSDPGNEFAHDADQVEPRLAPGLGIQRIDLDTAPIGQARGLLTASLNQGLGLLQYFGHGGLTSLSASGLLTTDDVPGLGNLGKTPFFAAMTCSINRYELVAYPSLGGDLVRSATGGAIAVWAPAGFSQSGEARFIGQALADVALRDSDQRVGDILSRTLSRYGLAGGDLQLASLYILLGDPATRMQVPRESHSGGGSSGVE